MEFEEPSKTVFTIYTKSGCGFCTKAKNLLLEKNFAFDLIDCDDYLIENREGFLAFIKELVGKEYRTFPMIFRSGYFIGGFTETKNLFELEDALANFM